MKRLRFLTIMTLGLAMLASCGETKTTKTSSQGAPYEIIVVASNENWNSPLGDTIRTVMQEQIPVFNGPEPLYTLQRIQPANFDGLVTFHRNIMTINTGSQYETPNMLAQYDPYATPQLMVHLVGPDLKSLTDYVSDHRNELKAIYEIAERDRDIAFNKRAIDKILSQKLEQKFGFSMALPKGYLLRNEIGDNFMWISREYPQSSQGMMIYSYPYTDRNNFTLDSLLRRRNEFAKLVPGENPGSYMTTVPIFTPVLKHIRVNGRYWAEMRGLWEVYKDFMGGPFVSYSTLDTETKRVITIDFYVYSPDPNYPRRNFYRQLEHLIYSVSFLSDQKQAADSDPTASDIAPDTASQE